MSSLRKTFGDYVFVSLTLMVGLAATAYVALAEHRRNEVGLHDTFHIAATDRINVISGALQANLAVNRSVVAFFQSSKEVDRGEFASFTSQILKDHPYISTLEWAPRVELKSRDAFVAKERKSVREFALKDVAVNGELVPAAPRNLYYPVKYLEPMTKESAAILGVDFMTSPIRRKAMEFAMNSGQTAATAKVTLLAGHRPGVLFFSPVVKDGALDGFVISIVPLEPLVAKAVESLNMEGVNIIAHDITNLGKDDKGQVMFTRSSRLKDAKSEEIQQSYLASALRVSDTIDVASRKWRVTVLPAKGYFTAKVTEDVYAILAGGSLFTLLLAWYMHSRIRENVRITREVQTRTQELEHMARYDLLTGLANRRLFIEILHRSLARAKRIKSRVGVIYMDLNGFNRLNETMGHAAGDAVLKEFGARAQRALRECDTTARLGGDKFAVIMDDVHSPLDCEAMLARMLSALLQPFAFGDKTIPLSASIGIAIFPENAGTVDELLANADEAMHEARADKSKSYIFSGKQGASGT